jgi:hypothetical protein
MTFKWEGARASWLLAWLIAGGACACSADPASGRVPSNGPIGGSAGAAGAMIGGVGGMLAPSNPESGTRAPEPVPTGGAGGNDGSCAAVQAEATAQLQPSDIVWAIDTSGSMLATFPAIQAALNQFSQSIIAAGIDAHIVLLAGAQLCVPAPLGSGAACAPGLGGFPPPRVDDSNDPAFLHLDTPFGFGEGMGVILDNFEHYRHMLRPDAHAQLVITEDGTPPMASAMITEHVEGRASATATPPWMPPLQAGRYTWNGVICGDGPMGCGLFGPPLATTELIAQTGGITAELGLANAGGDPFAELLEKLATAVIIGAKVGCDYEIPPAPDGKTFDRDLVNVVYSASAGGDTTFPRVSSSDACAEHTGWFYDDPMIPMRVTLCPSTCDIVQADNAAKVRLGFGCETLLAPE